MADLSGLNSSQVVSIVGSDSSGSETNPVNSTAQGRLLVESRKYAAPTYSVLIVSIAPGNNKSMLSIVNAAGSGKIVRMSDLKINSVQISAVTGVFLFYEFRRITNHSGGTLSSVNQNDTADAATICTVRTASTVTGEGSLIKRHHYSSDEKTIKTLGLENMETAINRDLNLLSTVDGNKSLILRPGEGFHLKCATNTTVGLFDFNLTWSEDVI